MATTEEKDLLIKQLREKVEKLEKEKEELRLKVLRREDFTKSVIGLGNDFGLKTEELLDDLKPLLKILTHKIFVFEKTHLAGLELHVE